MVEDCSGRISEYQGFLIERYLLVTTDVMHIIWQCCRLDTVTISLSIKMFIRYTSNYCASMVNAPKVLQPYWLIVLPLDVPALTASLLL